MWYSHRLTKNLKTIDHKARSYTSSHHDKSWSWMVASILPIKKWSQVKIKSSISFSSSFTTGKKYTSNYNIYTGFTFQTKIKRRKKNIMLQTSYPIFPLFWIPETNITIQIQIQTTICARDMHKLQSGMLKPGSTGTKHTSQKVFT